MSIKKSKSVILGEVYEKVLPFLPDFPYKPRDMTFV
jgi:predicted Holliday junction resolvase-like endonuclease